MAEYILQREQWIPKPIGEVFAFFADASNLEALTPPWLGFRILTPKPIVMRAGAHIAYRVGLHGFPMRWLTEIESWDPPNRFVDIQLKGPYRLWHHTHRFEPEKGGTRITDEVRYALRFGFMGRLAHRWLVQRDLQTIFDYREHKIKELLGASATGAGLTAAD